jgi:poly(A) polymerase
VAPSFLLACMLWHDVQDRWTALRKEGLHPFPALQQAVDAVFDARIGDISGRGKLAADMREIWMMQPRFERRTGPTPYTLVEQPRYRAGFDFLRLRADAGEADAELADWWEDFALGDDDEREALIAAVRTAPRSRRPAPASSPAPSPGAASAEAGEAAPARRRRRRRRKPAADGDAAGADSMAGGPGAPDESPPSP